MPSTARRSYRVAVLGTSIMCFGLAVIVWAAGHPFLAVIVFGANMGLAPVRRPNVGKSGLKNPRGIRC